MARCSEKANPLGIQVWPQSHTMGFDPSSVYWYGLVPQHDARSRERRNSINWRVHEDEQDRARPFSTLTDSPGRIVGSRTNFRVRTKRHGKLSRLPDLPCRRRRWLGLSDCRSRAQASLRSTLDAHDGPRRDYGEDQIG